MTWGGTGLTLLSGKEALWCCYLGRNPHAAATWGRRTPLSLLPAEVLPATVTRGGTHLLHILRDVLQLLEGGLVRCEHGEQGPKARGHRAEVYSLSHGGGVGGGGPQHGAPLPAQVCLLALQLRVRSFRCTLTSRRSLAVTRCFSCVRVRVFSSCAGRDVGHLSRTDAKHRSRCSLTHTLTHQRCFCL